MWIKIIVIHCSQNDVLFKKRSSSYGRPFCSEVKLHLRISELVERLTKESAVSFETPFDNFLIMISIYLIPFIMCKRQNFLFYSLIKITRTIKIPIKTKA